MWRGRKWGALDVVTALGGARVLGAVSAVGAARAKLRVDGCLQGLCEQHRGKGGSGERWERRAVGAATALDGAKVLGVASAVGVTRVGRRANECLQGLTTQTSYNYERSFAAVDAEFGADVSVDSFVDSLETVLQPDTTSPAARHRCPGKPSAIHVHAKVVRQRRGVL